VPTKNSYSEDSWRFRLHEIIFEADTPAGKAFDIVLLASIVMSVAAVMLESIAVVRKDYAAELHYVEWFFTILFTVEYVLRLVCVGRPIKYATSFYGVIDFLAIIPTYLSVLVPGGQYLIVVRLLRVLRIFRILKTVQYISEATILVHALRASGRKIAIFMFAVLTLVVVFGSLMYVIEGEANGFTSIPRSIYWAIVTLTTVGYGDISPKTPLGQALASMVMILGYSIIAVPTGIVTAEMSYAFAGRKLSTQVCRECSREGHDNDAVFCKFCGAKL